MSIELTESDRRFMRTVQRNCWHRGDPGRPPGSRDKRKRPVHNYSPHGWDENGLRCKFIDRVEVQRDGCWKWMGAQSHGFGYLVYRSRQAAEGYPPTIQAHRLSWEIHCEFIPDGMLVGQQCENKLCVNPAHLYLWRQ